MYQSSQKMSLKTLTIIWGALMASQVIYGIALQTIVKDQEPQELQIPMVAALSMMAVVMCVLSFFLPKFILNQLKKDQFKNPGDNQRASISQLIQVYSSPFIIRLAMLESCALFGFALAFIHKRIELFLPFATLSIGLFILNFPTEEKVRNAFK